MTTVLYMTDKAPLDLYRFLEHERRVRIEKNPRPHANTIASAGMLLAYAAVIKAGLRLPLEIIRVAKPYLKGKEFEFSLSHTAGLSACAYSDSPTGVDAELIREVPIELFEKFNIPKSNDLALFFEYWTALESLYKLYGGKYSLAQIKLSPCKNGFIDSYGCAVSIFKTGGYVISAAGTEPVNFIEVSAADLKTVLK